MRVDTYDVVMMPALPHPAIVVRGDTPEGAHQGMNPFVEAVAAHPVMVIMMIHPQSHSPAKGTSILIASWRAWGLGTADRTG